MKTFKQFILESEAEVNERWLELRSEELANIIGEFRHRKPNTTQGWTVVPAARLIKIWNDYAKTGVIRDTRGLDVIVDRMIRNTIRLSINTELLGHTQNEPKYLFDEYDDENPMTPEENEALGDFIVDENGTWRLSDYGLPKLEKILFQLMSATGEVEKLLLVDQMLNVVHARSDLAGMFVEGGQNTLNKLAS